MVMVVVMSVCLCVCLSVKSHLTLEASLHPENDVMYSVGDKGQNICGVSLKLLHCSDRVLLPLDGHTYGRPFFLRITCMRIVHTQVDARAPCFKLSLHSV